MARGCWIAALLALGCQGGNEKYEDHASSAMARWANAEPTVAPGAFVPPADKVTAAATEISDIPPAPPSNEDGQDAPSIPATVRPAGEPGPSGANPPEFLRPKPEKTPEDLQLSLEFESPGQLHPNQIATLRFQVTPLKNAALLRVRYEVEGPAIVTPASSEVGASTAGHMLLAITRVELKPGRSKVTAWAEGFDVANQKIFEGKHTLYLIVAGEKVLTGSNGYRALEILELERQRDAGEIEAGSFSRQIRILKEAGAALE